MGCQMINFQVSTFQSDVGEFKNTTKKVFFWTVLPQNSITMQFNATEELHVVFYTSVKVGEFRNLKLRTEGQMKRVLRA